MLFNIIHLELSIYYTQLVINKFPTFFCLIKKKLFVVWMGYKNNNFQIHTKIFLLYLARHSLIDISIQEFLL